MTICLQTVMLDLNLSANVTFIGLQKYLNLEILPLVIFKLRDARSLYIPPIVSGDILFYPRAVCKKGCKDQESIQSSTTPDPGYQWESDELTVTKVCLLFNLITVKDVLLKLQTCVKHIETTGYAQEP